MRKSSFSSRRRGRRSKFRSSKQSKRYAKRINSYRVARGGIRL